jgi:hypothetical protein
VLDKNQSSGLMFERKSAGGSNWLRFECLTERLVVSAAFDKNLLKECWMKINHLV